MKPNLKSQKQRGPAGVHNGLELGLRDVQGSTEQHDTEYLCYKLSSVSMEKGKFKERVELG